MKDDPNSAMQALEEFERPETLHALTDVMTDGLVMIDTDAQIIFFSKGAERMFGFREEEVLGKSVSLLMPSPDREAPGQFLERYMRKGEKGIIGKNRVTTARRRDGGTFPMNLAVGEVTWRGSRAFTGFIRDLTYKWETERQLHSLQAELAHVSRINTMGSLATSIAHELNQPLTAAVNYAQAARDLLKLSDTKDNELLVEALDGCANQTLRAAEVLQRLRDFVSDRPRRRESASMQILVSEATALALMPHRVENVEIANRLDPAVDTVMVDPVQIQQVFLNLFKNSLEATGQGVSPKIEISSRPAEDGMVEICVADNGSGIPEGMKGKLFSPFVSTKSSDSGMGLGLSICQRIVNAHGGRIWLGNSRLGGAAICFTLHTGDWEQEG